jgi:putative transcriptional regulator
MQNRFFPSPDPLDHTAGLIDPVDQANANRDSGAPFPAYSGRLDVRALRERMHMTQGRFAGTFGFPVATLRHWERGNRYPTGTALVLLHVIRDNPRAVRQAVRKARMWDPDCLAGFEPRKSYRAPPGFGNRAARRRRGVLS